MAKKRRRGERVGDYNLSLDDDEGLDPSVETTTRKNGAEQWSQRALEQLDRQLVRALQEEAPQSCRQLFYRMCGGQVLNVQKTELHARRVQERVVVLRRNGLIPLSAIFDPTRSSSVAYTYADAGEFLETYAGAFHSDAWAEAPHYVEVICEARGTLGTIRQTCQDFGVTVTGLGGFLTITLANEIGVRAKERARGRPVRFLHLGDHDPSGLLIDAKAKEELSGSLTRFEYERLAVTPEQIAQYGLPKKPAKESTHNREGMTETVEAEAIPAETLRSIVAARLDDLLPDGALDQARAFDAEEQARLLAAARALR